MSDKKPSGLELLREPFKPNQISKLPKPYKKDSPKGRCAECGGYHGLPAVHLDYVGHAALTDRLLDADPSWNWEPLATHDGLPLLDKDGGLWIKLTVCGVTRLGYGDAQGKMGGDAMKERIGDALRNAAMRFGAALDLWHKGGNLHDDEDETPVAPTRRQVAPNNDGGFATGPDGEKVPVMQVKADPARDKLYARLHEAATDSMASLESAWKSLTKPEQHLIGAEGIKALKAEASK